jgi:hypothetical protein
MVASNLNLTDTEHSLLETVRHLLGDNLSGFLLSGLGETHVTHRRTFTAHSISAHVDERAYLFEIVSESHEGLSIDRDPLVLAALLDLLCERQPLDSTILFRRNDVLTKLQWPQDAATQLFIKRAIEKYVFTSYCLVDPSDAEEKRPGSHYVSVGRLLIGYETTGTLLSRKIPEQSPIMRVQFLPALIHDVISERKLFFGIEFQRLGRMQRTSS